MRKKVGLLILAVLVFSLLFTGCPEDPVELTAAEVESIAMASLGGGYMSTMFLEAYMAELMSAGAGVTIVESLASGIDATVSGTTMTITFTTAGIDVDDPQDGVTDMTINGVLSIATVGETMVFTYTNLSITGVIPGTTEELSATITGTVTMSATAFSVDVTISGIVDAAVEVVIEMAIVDEEPSGVTSATIDGTDYTTEFNTAFDGMGG